MSPKEWPLYEKALENFLASSQGNLTPATSSRVAKAREKLKKLTKIQFSDLSTDVYDEMKRREFSNQDPSNPNLPKFLASQPNYHPKRNQARQKLAALPPSRFKDLVNDVLFEIGNRMYKENIETPSAPIEKQVVETQSIVPNNMKNKANLEIDTNKAKQPFNDDFYSDLKTPQHSDFLSTTPVTPATPSQREIKPTTLVPQKSELTWSSDEDEEEGDNENFNAQTITENDLQQASPFDSDAINRSPSKRDTVATNEVLNAHALPHVEFPVDQDTSNDGENYESKNLLKTELNEIKLKINELESENSQLKLTNNEVNHIKSENEELKIQLEELSRKHLESDKNLRDISNKYEDYDQLKNELIQVTENFNIQNEELETLKEMANKEHEKQLSVEDSREFDTLKTYLDKVLEENEELKSKLAELSFASKNITDNSEELENLKVMHEDLSKSHATLNNDYKTLKSHSENLADKFEQQKISLEVANKFVNSNKSTTTIQANTSAVKDWQDKFEALRANQIMSTLTSTNSLQSFDDKSFFSNSGFISIENVSKINASLETILIYLDSKDTLSKSLVDPSVLFERVANYVSIANTIAKEIIIPTSDRNYIRLEEKKRILRNSISNVLSTTKHFALYRHILPQLVLNAALNDVYFSICSLILIAKIRGDGSKNVSDIQQQLLEDKATVTGTPIALKSMNSHEERSSSIDANISTNNETSVKPLKITQRLASGSTLDLNDFSKPSQLTNSRTGSPIGRKMLSPILPVIVATGNNDSLGSPKLSYGKVRSVNKQADVDNVNNTNLTSASSLNMKPQTDADTSTVSINSITSNSLTSDNNKQPYVNGNSSKVSVSDLASKFSSPTHDISSNISKNNNSPSPARGKNIVDKLKKFDTSTDDIKIDNSSNNNIKDSPTSAKAKFGGGVAKAFDRFGAKRRSVEPAGAILKENFHDDSRSNNNNNSNTEISHSNGGSNKVLLDKDLNTVNDTNNNNPFLDNSSDVKKGGLFEPKEKVNAAVIDVIPQQEREARIIEQTLDNNIPKQQNGLNNTSKQVSDSNNSKEVIAVEQENGVDTTDNAESFEGDEYYNASDHQNIKISKSSFSSINEVKDDLPDLNTLPSTENKDSDTKPLNSDITTTHEEEYDDFNEYEGPTKIVDNADETIPSAGSALDIDEGLVRRVSKRQNHTTNVKRISTESSEDLEPQSTQEGWDYNGEASDEDEEEFDIDKFNTLNPDNTLRELLLYLEHQTVEVIGAIQKTLQSIRDPKATKGLLRTGTNEINTVVKQMAEGTSTLMNQSRYSDSMGHAKYVVGVLEDCVHRMETLYGDDISHDSEYAGKNFKQRSAGIAFDVARSTKELVKTVEEASLRDEIAVLDSRLRRD